MIKRYCRSLAADPVKTGILTALTFWAVYVGGSKPPTPPVAPPDDGAIDKGIIRLYHEEDGRLIPFHIPIIEQK
jgi:hypothetical protein